MQEYIDMWLNFANFEGRTNRRGYWMAVLMNFLILFLAGILAAFIPFISFLIWLYGLAFIVPSLAIAVRRLRDAGHRWYCIFLSLIPVVGEIILLVFLIHPSKYDGGEAKPLLGDPY